MTRAHPPLRRAAVGPSLVLLVAAACAAGDGPVDTDTDTDPPDTDAADTDPTDDTDVVPVTCEAGEYVGDVTWTAALHVAEGGRLCAFPAREMNWQGEETPEQAFLRSLAAALAAKSVMVPVPGAYPLPAESVEAALRLPACVSDGGEPGVALGTAPRVDVETIDGGIGIESGIYVRATMPLGAGSVDLQLGRPLDEPITVTLSASPQADHQVGVTGRRGDDRLYTTCALAPNDCVDLDLGDLGALSVDAYVWRASPGQGLAVPRRVSGSFRGTPVDITDYARLTDIYGHHAFDRHLFVRFATPIDGACGVRLDMADFGMWKAAPAGCDGALLEGWTDATTTTRECGR